MTETLVDLLLRMSTSVALSVVLKATVIAAAGLFLAKAMRRARASRRFVVLASTFAALATVPFIVAFAPVMPIVVRDSVIAASTPSAIPASRFDAPEGGMAIQSVAVASVNAGTLLVMAWGIGMVIALVPVLMTVRRLQELRKSARAWPALRDAGRAQVLVHDQLAVPITFGWWKPQVLLPGDVDTWPAANVQCALAHELEHVNRRDWPVHVFARVVCAAYWFHPLVWTAWRQLHLEADRACDDAVASRYDARQFAEQLIALAGRIRSHVPAPALSMASGNLVSRVHSLLRANQVRGRSGRGFGLGISLSAILIGSGISTIEAVERTTIEAPPTPAQTSSAQPALPPSGRTLTNQSAASQTSRPVTKASPAPREVAVAVQTPTSPAAVQAAGDYVIGPGDVLAITFWGEKELTGDYVVRPDGKITVPVIQDVDSAGLTPIQLRDRLTAMSARLLSNAQITVGIKAIKARKVYITGGVIKPGAYDLSDTTSVMHLISMAGGLRQFVVGRNISIIRSDGGNQTVIPFDYREVISGRNLGQNIMLRPGDTVVVPD